MLGTIGRTVHYMSTAGLICADIAAPLRLSSCTPGKVMRCTIVGIMLDVQLHGPSGSSHQWSQCTRNLDELQVGARVCRKVSSLSCTQEAATTSLVRPLTRHEQRRRKRCERSTI